MNSTWIPVVTIVLGIMGAFWAAGGAEHFAMGVYGIGFAAVGMLSTLGITLATDAFGPIADNAGGNAEMAELDRLPDGERNLAFLRCWTRKEAFLKATALCKAAGGRAGIALSDPFCVDRHRADFRRLVAEQMDYVIGNEQEWTSLYQTDDLEKALAYAAVDCGLVICTRSGDDVVLIRGQERVEVPVHRVTPVDATGAGDQFAAGFLYGLGTGRDLETCGRMGVICAAEVISHMGPRPQTDTRDLFRTAGLL